MKPKVWIITDTHFGHERMSEYCGRPDDFSEQILTKLERELSPGDTLIHLGDICFGRDEYWHNLLPKFVKKILVRGNHDKKSNDWYLAHGWDFVCDEFSTTYFGRYVTFSHQPIPNIQNLNVHGHFHNHLPRLLEKRWIVEGEEERNSTILDGLNENHKLIFMEGTNYHPVLLEKFISIKKNEK